MKRKSRERNALFVVEGVRAVEELAKSPLRIVGALASPQLTATPRGVVLRDLPGTPYIRASVGAWNDEQDLERLVSALAA